jgi:hypothetical protein
MLDIEYFQTPCHQALHYAIGDVCKRGIGRFRLVPRPDGFAVVRLAAYDAPLDEVLLEVTVFTSDVCSYAAIEEYFGGGGLHRWGLLGILDVVVRQQPREITCEVYVRLGSRGAG